MTDHRRRSLLPDRVLLPPAPRDRAAAERWQALSFEERRRLALMANRDGPDAAGNGDAELVGALAEARVATGWRLQVAAAILGWLVLMTIWGFGRSTFPADEDRWLVAGALLGLVAWVLAAVAARRRIRRATRVAARAAARRRPRRHGHPGR